MQMWLTVEQKRADREDKHRQDEMDREQKRWEDDVEREERLMKQMREQIATLSKKTGVGE